MLVKTVKKKLLQSLITVNFSDVYKRNANKQLILYEGKWFKNKNIETNSTSVA